MRISTSRCAGQNTTLVKTKENEILGNEQGIPGMFLHPRLIMVPMSNSTYSYFCRFLVYEWHPGRAPILPQGTEHTPATEQHRERHIIGTDGRLVTAAANGASWWHNAGDGSERWKRHSATLHLRGDLGEESCGVIGGVGVETAWGGMGLYNTYRSVHYSTRVGRLQLGYVRKEMENRWSELSISEPVARLRL